MHLLKITIFGQVYHVPVSALIPKDQLLRHVEEKIARNYIYFLYQELIAHMVVSTPFSLFKYDAPIKFYKILESPNFNLLLGNRADPS